MISFVIASIGRPSLEATLKSIECREGDEIVVIGNMGDVVDSRVRLIPCEPGRDWGHTERNHAATFFRGSYVAHIDDDDLYAPGTRDFMQDAITKNPEQPILFRMKYPNGITLWCEPVLRCGNVGTPMILIPNIPQKFGHWGSFVGGDCHFLETMAWKPEEIVWRSEVIALLGHNT